MIFLLIISAQAGENLINNPSFEESNNEGLAAGFYTDSYQDPSYTTVFKLSDNSHTGLKSVYIRNAASNDSRFVQTLAVEPDTVYKLSGYILASVAEEGKGANLSIEGVYSFTEPLYDTEGEWQYVELYGKTGKNQRELSIYVRLGGYSGESEGEAYFDDIALEKVDNYSGEYDNWFAAPRENKQSDLEDKGLHRRTIYISTVAYMVLAYIALNFIRKHDIKDNKLVLTIGLIIAFLIRIILAYRIYGHGIDMACFIGWANALNNFGIGGFYDSINFCDYPPGFMYVLRIHGFLFSVLKPSENIIWLITKLPAMLCDIFSAIMLYSVAKKKSHGALVCALLYAFNPLVIITSSVWGQIDSVFTFLILLACCLLIKSRIDFAIPVYTLSCLVKPQGLMFGPIALVYLIRLLLSDKALIKKLIIGLLLGAIVFAAIVVPFTPEGRGLDWIVKKYTETLSSYDYATVNTTNIFYIMGANWVKQDSNISIEFAIVYLAILVVLLVYLILKNKRFFNNIKKNLSCKYIIALAIYVVTLKVVYLINPIYLAFSTVNLIFTIALDILLIFVMAKNRISYILALALLSMYCMTVRMHERYVFAAVALFMLDYAFSKNIKSLIMGLLTSLAVYINVAIVLDNTIVLGTQLGHLNNDTLGLGVVLSVYNFFVLALGIYFAFSADFEFKKPEDLSNMTNSIAEEKLLIKKQVLIDKKDIFIMLAIMLVYSIPAFYRLGSFRAPQKMFVTSAPDESVVLELEDNTEFNILYYGGINYSSVNFSVSDDGENFGEEYPAELNQSQIFKWKYLSQSSEGGDGNLNFSHTPILFSGKYIRITAEEAGVSLGEIIVRKPSKDGVVGDVIKIKPIEHIGQDDDFSNTSPELLCDEQDSLQGEPGYYNSSYFDEIYHARTGYEFVHGIRPYETSHPPLGKLFMSLGILIFGMTPFGYRFFGVVAGVAMLPAIYVSAKYLFDNRKLATAACLLFALDLMHLAQTRIATIDSYPVLFILLSFMFMLKYILLNHFAISLKKTFTPLLFSGIFFGLSVASKWIGLYAGVGLAIMFFTSQFVQIKAGILAKSRLGENSSDIEKEAAENYIDRFIQTCVVCVFFFILIPFVIYYLSYIPYFVSSGGITFKKLIDAQVGMFSYHSSPGLGMDHPFYSPWWQWPFILKPMWFYLGYYEPQGINETIYCMGNPIIFYVSAFTMLATIIIFLYKLISGKRENICISFAISIGFLSQYLPWTLVPRGTYMYHYFASVPFIILSAMYIFYLAYNNFKSRKKLIDVLLIIFILAALAMFIGFYPYASGIPVSNKWLDAMKWFKGIGY